MPQNVYVRGVAMEQKDWDAVQAFAEKNGLGVSSAMRMILRQWQASQSEKDAPANGTTNESPQSEKSD